MAKPLTNRVIANIDDIYWQLNDMTKKSVVSKNYSTIFWIMGITLLVLSCFGMFVLIIPALVVIVLAMVKGKSARADRLEYYKFLVGIIEAVRDDVRVSKLLQIDLRPDSNNKRIVSNKTTREPRFSEVRRIKYKYIIAKLRFTLIDGNILKVTVFKKEREKIKRDHAYKRSLRERYSLKLRLDINKNIYDTCQTDDRMAGNYELTPNIVISGVERLEEHVNLKANLVKMDQYSGRQVAGMIKFMYRGLELKKFSLV